MRRLTAKPDARPSSQKKARYRGPKHVWRGWTPVDNWRGNPALFERVYIPMKSLSGFPYAASYLRDVDIELQIIDNVAEAARKARREAGRKVGEEWTRFSPTIVGAAVGHTRKVVRAAFQALVDAGFDEKRVKGSRVFFRPRPIDHDRAEAFARYVEQHEGFPPDSWWSESGPHGTTIRDTSIDTRDSGPHGTTSDVRSGPYGTSDRSPRDRSNGETPLQPQGSAGEELIKTSKELVTPAAPPASEGPPARAGNDGRPAKRWPDAPLCYVCGNPLDAETLASEDPVVQGFCAACRSM